MPVSPLDDLRVEDWEEMSDINIKGVLYDIAAALSIWLSSGRRTDACSWRRTGRRG